MANRKHVESIPVGPLAIVALSGSKALGETVDAYIADWRKTRIETNDSPITFKEEQTMNNSTFEILNAVNVNGHTEKKNGLTYLSWAWAWAELLKHCPDATYTVYENAQGWNYHTDGRTCWVKTGVTVAGREYIEMLPVMDFKNRSIELAAVTSTDVNKAIQRSLTKAVARHGLGLYIYAGEGIPEAAEDLPADEKPRPEAPSPRANAKPRATVTILSPSPSPAPVITSDPVPAAADASAHPYGCRA